MSVSGSDLKVSGVLGASALIGRDAITLSSWGGGARTIRKMELAGYRTGAARGVTYVFLVSRDPGAKKIRFSVQNSKAAMALAALAPLPDLDAADIAAATEAIRQSELWGSNPEDRIAALANEKRVVLALNWAGGLIGAWALFYPHPREWAIGACTAGVVGLLLATVFKQGRWRIDVNKNDPRPSVAIALFVCIAALGARALFDVSMFDWQPWLGAGALVGVVAAAVLPLLFPELKGVAAMITVVVSGFVFGIGCAGVGDTMFDTAPLQVYKAQIVEKYESQGRTTSYNWVLGPWGPSSGGTQDVGGDLYDQLNVGDAACVYFHPGALHMRWYVVSTCGKL
jgi:hypothetical protein